MDKVWCAFDRVKQEGGKVLTILRNSDQLVLGAVLLRNPQVHPRLRFPASSTSGLRAGNPSLFLCFEQVCTKVFFAVLASGVGVPVNEAGLSGNQPPILVKSTTFLGNPSPALGKSAFDFGEIRRNPSPILPPTLEKFATDFVEIRCRFWGNLSPTLGKSVTDFGEIRRRFWGNPSPILGKFVTDFGEIRRRFWGNQRPTLGKSATDFGEISHRLWGKTGSVLGKDWLAFRERLARFGRNWFGFWIGLRQSSSLTVLNAKHVWVWMSLKVNQPVGSWKGKMLKPINFDIETVLGFVLATCMRCHKHKLIYIVPIEDEHT